MACVGGTIVNPSIPYSCPISGGMQHGKMIIIQGTCHHHQNSFSINLSCGPQVEPLGDVALHFNPRFNEQCIVRNHKQGSWGSEERGGGMPLHKGTPFEIILMSDPHHFKVSINGKHFCNFHHRMSKDAAQYLVLAGEVCISYVKFEGGCASSFVQPPPFIQPPPYNAPPFHAPPFVQPPVPGFDCTPPTTYPHPGSSAGYPGAGQPVYNPPVPYSCSVPGGLYPGKMIYISGVPHPNASRFSINLMCSPSENGDIAFHFDVRFNYNGIYNQTIRTHKVGSTWGTEEKHQSLFPFVPNANFDMIILVEPASIKIAVNNQHFCEFNHRIQPLNIIGFMLIKGDVRLTSVRVQ